MTLSPTFLVAAAAALVVSLVLVWLGLRGRRVDEHPVCRRCGFDLFGTPAGREVCGECGASLARRRAVRIGNRERRPQMAVGGALLLVPAVLVLGAAGYVALRGIDLQRHKPAWLLAREAEASTPSGRRAISELIRRVKTGELSDRWCDKLAARALAHQADLGRPFDRMWSWFLHEARDAGKLSDDQWRTFGDQAIVPELKVRPRVRRGDPVWLEVSVRHVRLGQGDVWHVATELTCQIDDVRVPTPALGGFTFGSGQRQHVPHAAGLVLDPATLDELADGRHTLRLTFDVELTTETDWRKRRATIGRVPRILECPFTLLPADEPTVALAADPDLLRATRDKLRVPWVAVSAHGDYAQAEVRLPDGVEVDHAYDVWLSAGGRQTCLGAVAGGRHDPLRGLSAGTKLDDALAGRGPVDVILRPSVEAAVRTLSVERIADEPLAFRGVPVLPLEAAAPTPTTRALAPVGR